MGNNGLRRRLVALEQRIGPSDLEAIEQRDVLRLLEYLTVDELHQIVDDLIDDGDDWQDDELQMVTELLARAERRRAAGEKPER